MVKQFHILTEDIDTIKRISPRIYESLNKFFSFTWYENRRHLTGYVECRLVFGLVPRFVRRRYLSLIHSVHVMACDLYRQGLFLDYLVFDGLMSQLIMML